MTNTQNFFDRFLEGFVDTIGEDSEHFREVNEQVLSDKGVDYKSATRFERMVAENPTFATIADAFELGDQDLRDERKARGMGLSDDAAKKAGQVAGRIGQDVVRDGVRSMYWLLNAPQAVVDIAAEEGIKRANPDLRKETIVRDFEGNKVYVDTKDFNQSDKVGATKNGVKQKGFSYGPPEEFTDQYGNTRTRRAYTRANIEPGIVNSLRGPAAMAINAGMGLLHYGGGMEGYTAAIPSEDDPTKTANVLAEIGAKYIVGRTGDLLPYDEFVKVRPDVSKDEYRAYKAFKYDKAMDLDPRDGDVNLLPLGLLKATAQGIHGPEVQFLGRSLPLNETGIPVATAVLGTIAGVYGGEKARQAYEKDGTKGMGVVPPVMPEKDLQPGSEAERKSLRTRTVRRGMVGGLGGYAAGALTGNLIEDERRKRNKAENERDGSLYRS